MGEEQSWPRFMLVIYVEPTGIPHGWDRDLIALGVPQRILGNHYTALRHLELVEHPALGFLVRFALVGRRGGICFHPATQSIHWLTGARSGQERFVNTTLAQFNESVRTVIDRFPFDRDVASTAHPHDTSARWYSRATGQRSDVQWGHVGEELRELLRRIDPESVAHPDGYWNSFVNDVQMGDYSTDDVLNSPGKAQMITRRSAT